MEIPFDQKLLLTFMYKSVAGIRGPGDAEHARADCRELSDDKYFE
jgi:hypothetical protein